MANNQSEGKSTFPLPPKKKAQKKGYKKWIKFIHSDMMKIKFSFFFFYPFHKISGICLLLLTFGEQSKRHSKIKKPKIMQKRLDKPLRFL